MTTEVISTKYKKICDIQSKSKDSMCVNEVLSTHNKYIQKIIQINNITDDIKGIFISNSSKIKYISIYKGILPICDFSYLNYPIIVTEYKQKGTLENFIMQRANSQQEPKIYKDTTTFIILLGIANTLNYLQIHELFFDSFDSSKIYLDDNLYPQIDITEFSIQNHKAQDYSIRSKDEIFSFGQIAYELITCQKSFSEDEEALPDLSKIDIKWLRDLIEKC